MCVRGEHIYTSILSLYCQIIDVTFWWTKTRSIVNGTTQLNRHWMLHNVKCLQPIILATTVTHIPLWSMHKTCSLKSCIRKDVAFCWIWYSFVIQSVNFLLTSQVIKYCEWENLHMVKLSKQRLKTNNVTNGVFVNVQYSLIID
jgi:hypothetical protein